MNVAEHSIEVCSKTLNFIYSIYDNGTGTPYRIPVHLNAHFIQTLVLLRLIIITTVSHRHSVDCIVCICDMKDKARITKNSTDDSCSAETEYRSRSSVVHVASAFINIWSVRKITSSIPIEICVDRFYEPRNPCPLIGRYNVLCRWCWEQSQFQFRSEQFVFVISPRFSDQPIPECKMNFTNLLFKVVSLSNLNIFLHRLIDDGQYNSVFLYHNHALARDTNFRQEFSNYSSRYFTITTHCIGDEGCHDRFITNHIEGSLQIYIVYDANPNNIHRMDYYIKQRYATVGDTLYVIPMQNPRRKWKILNVDTGVNAQVVFYQTPETIENHISEKPIEVFLLNWALLSLRRYHILEVAIPSPSDRIHNFYSEVFQSEGQTVLMFMHRLDSWQRSEMVNNPERIMSYNKDVYMMNYICMNSRALVVQGMHKFNVDHFYALSDEKIYSELFISLRSTTKRQLRQM